MSILISDQPDIVIIHVGTNSLIKVCQIATDLFKIVKICRDNGVDNIYISGMIYRTAFDVNIKELNTFLISKQLVHDYTFINNTNVTRKDIGGDNIHLRYSGNLANNFVDVINIVHTT